MNWHRGLKRITLVLSIVGAVIAGLSFGNSYDTGGIDVLELAIITAIGGLLGFAGVWAVYAAAKWGARPLCKWILRGFREDKQKDAQKTNE